MAEARGPTRCGGRISRLDEPIRAGREPLLIVARMRDSPAHGSRFDAKGKVTNGPANVDRSPVEQDAHAADK